MKGKSIFLIVLICLFLSSVGQAASNPIVQISMNGNNLSVTKAPIMMDGNKISSDIRSFIHNDRTLVHIRFIEETSDAQVSWEPKTKTVIVNHEGNQVRLTIDSETATINGEKRILDKASIPRLVKYEGEKDAKTMVPLRFLAETFGFDVGWDAKNSSAYINSKTGKEEPIVDLTNKVSNIKKELIDGKNAIVIYGTKKVNSKIMKLNNPNRIVVDLMDSTLQSSILNRYDYDLEFVKNIRVSQFAPDSNYKKDDKIVRIVLDVKDGVVNSDISIDTKEDRLIIFPKRTFVSDTDKNTGNTGNVGTNIELPNDKTDKEPVKNNPNLKPSDRLIVIDPGHGGTDPGAVSPNGVKEKDVNLQISLKTRNTLKNAGYNVLMTRDGDTYPTLEQRPDLANKNSADIFISIHANSVLNVPSANGIEILYAPSSTGSHKEEGQQVLAKVILDELIKATGATNRNIKQRPNLAVLRGSNMPAILIEVGFLSNANEEKLITSNDYQNKIAAAIVRGIERYFKTY